MGEKFKDDDVGGQDWGSKGEEGSELRQSKHYTL